MKKFIIFFLIFSSFFTIGSGGVLASKIELPTDVKDIIKNIREKHKDSLDSATITRIIPDIFKEIFRKSFPTISQFSAINTLRLGGKTENSFLKNKLCENGKVYKSIGADGQPICGYKNEKMMLVRVFSGSVEAGSKNNRITYNTGEDISFNEEINIRTTNQEAVLQFADNSIIRLAKKTGILLSAVSSKNTSNNTTIAQVSLDGGGLLWGRVLNSEIQFRSGDVIAGVRGTSIALSDNNNQKTIEIIDSRNPTNAAMLYDNNGKQLATLGVQERYHVDGGRKETGLKKSEQWKRHEFFRESERNDHIYISTLIDKIENQKQNIGIEKEILKEESTASTPTITTEHEALCGPGKVFWTTELNKEKQCKSENLLVIIQNGILTSPNHKKNTKEKGKADKLKIKSLWIKNAQGLVVEQKGQYWKMLNKNGYEVFQIRIKPEKEYRKNIIEDLECFEVGEEVGVPSILKHEGLRGVTIEGYKDLCSKK